MTLYASCSLLAASIKGDGKKESNDENNKGAIEASVEWLMDNEFINIQKDGQGTAVVCTSRSEFSQICHNLCCLWVSRGAILS